MLYNTGMKYVLTNLPVQIFKQGKAYIAYTPVLDISTVGKDQKQAKARFAELVGIFFEEIEKNGTIHQVLSELGWKRKAQTWQPPVVTSRFVGAKIPVTA